MNIGPLRYIIVVAALTGTLSAPAPAREGTIRDVGDILQFALPAAALTSTFIADDPEGRLQWALSQGTTGVLTGLGKLSFEKLRPSGGSRTSFPSGHTSAVFSAASFMGTRYGALYGVPAYAAAGFTAYSRVWADAHFANDVVAGAGMAMLVNFALVNPRDENVIVTPAIFSGDAVGIRFTLLNSDSGSESSVERQRRIFADFEPKVRFRLDTGWAFQKQNEVTAPKDGGTTFDFDSFEKIDDPTTVATLHGDWLINPNHSVTLAFTPFEARDAGQFATPVSFGGVVFPDSSTIRSEYRLNELRGYYNYTFDSDSAWTFQVGGGAHVQRTEIKLTEVATGIESEISDNVILPVLRGNIDYRLGNGFTLWGEAEGIVLPDDSLFEAAVGVKYDISPRWETNLSFGYASRDIDTSDLKNTYEYESVMFSFAYKM